MCDLSRTTAFTFEIVARYYCRWQSVGQVEDHVVDTHRVHEYVDVVVLPGDIARRRRMTSCIASIGLPWSRRTPDRAPSLHQTPPSGKTRIACFGRRAGWRMRRRDKQTGLPSMRKCSIYLRSYIMPYHSLLRSCLIAWSEHTY